MLEFIGIIRQCLRWFKSIFNNIQAIERRFQKLLGSTDQKTGLTDWNTGLQNFKFGPAVVQTQKGIGFQIYFF